MSVATSSEATRVAIPTRVQRARRLLSGREAGVAALAVVVWIVVAIVVKGFTTATTAYYMGLDLFPIIMLALPMTMIIITGEVDLSIGSMTGLASVVVGILYSWGVSIPIAVVVAIVVGALGGFINGMLVARVGLASLAVTIGTMALYRGMAVGALGTEAITSFPNEYRQFVTGRLFGPGTAVPTMVLIFVIAAVLFIAWLHYTSFGRGVYAVGMSPKAAAFAGVESLRLKLILFMSSGAMAGLMGAYWALRYNSARGDNATGLELMVVAGALVGGVSFFGGSGSLVGACIGCIVIGLLRSSLRLGDVPEDAINVAVGLLLIVTVVGPRAMELLKLKTAELRLRRSGTGRNRATNEDAISNHQNQRKVTE
nr:ABC transporter permease [Propionicimonas sp.]